MKKVRIVNDGGPWWESAVTDVETGAMLNSVIAAEIHIGVISPVDGKITHSDDPATAILIIAEPVIDIIADAEIRRVCPSCGRPIDEKKESPDA